MSIIAFGFDTTSSNSGVHKGECTILKDLLSLGILWMTCRKHILELVVKSAFHAQFGDTSSPTVNLFKILKEPTLWNSLDLADLQFPPLPRAYEHEAARLLVFINHRFEAEDPATLPRLKRSGADSQARWMSKCIYVLKFALLLHRLPNNTIF